MNEQIRLPHKIVHVTYTSLSSSILVLYCKHCGLVVYHDDQSGELNGLLQSTSVGGCLAPKLKMPEMTISAVPIPPEILRDMVDQMGAPDDDEPERH